MLGDSIRRRTETSRRWLPFAAAAGWAAFGVLLLLHIGSQIQNSRYQREVATEFYRYQQHVESQVRVAMARANELEDQLATCSMPAARGGLLAGILPTVLQALGTPPALARLIPELLN